MNEIKISEQTLYNLAADVSAVDVRPQYMPTKGITCVGLVVNKSTLLRIGAEIQRTMDSGGLNPILGLYMIDHYQIDSAISHYIIYWPYLKTDIKEEV